MCLECSTIKTPLSFKIFLSKTKFTIFKKTDKLLKDDKAFILTNSKQVDRTLSIFGRDEKFAKTILIIGAGNIGLDLAKLLEEDEQKPRIKIIEKNKIQKKCDPRSKNIISLKGMSDLSYKIPTD